jgi:hypothetical protein
MSIGKLTSRSKRLQGLRTFQNHIWKKYLVYLSLKYTDETELYLEKIMKFSIEKGLGKQVLNKILKYMKERNYKILRIRVYPLNRDIGTATKEELEKLVLYYNVIGFIPDGNKFEDITGKEPFEMIYTIGGD